MSKTVRGILSNSVVQGQGEWKLVGRMRFNVLDEDRIIEKTEQFSFSDLPKDIQLQYDAACRAIAQYIVDNE